MRGRATTAAIAVFVAAAIAAPAAEIDRAQGSPDATAAQTAEPDATNAPMAFGGPDGRIALPGPWTLRGDHSGHGSLKGWQAGGFEGSTVDLPNAPNAKRVTGQDGIESFRGSVGWYRTSFTVPDTGEYALRFESVNHKATVWLDGRQIGRHTGEYLPFEYDVPLDSGRAHELVVRADWRDPSAMKRAAWHRTWFNFGGVNREVTIRKLAASEITAPTVRTRLNADGSADVDLSIHLDNRAQTREVPAKGALVHDGKRYEFSFPTLQIPGGQTRVVSATVHVPDPALWSPDAPNLYDLELQVPGETGYELRTGLRQIERRGSRMLLNGRPITLRGASIHEDAQGRGDALTTSDMDQLVAELKAIGANATRSQHPLSPALLERLDAAGIMVWMGVGPVDAPGAWTSKTDKLREQAKRRVRTSLYQLQTHPSIIAWNLANEVAGNGHPGGQASYIDGMARELKRRDPGRLIGLDVWGAHPPSVAGPMYRNIDAVGDTNYIGWYEDTLAGPSAVAQAIRDHITAFASTFKGKIVVVTEFGAEANGLNPTDRPGGYRFQADLLRRHIEIYRSMPRLTGMLVWNLRDFAVAPSFAGGSIRRQVPDIRLVRGLNQKGLFDYDGRAKPSAAVVRDALAGK